MFFFFYYFWTDNYIFPYFAHVSSDKTSTTDSFHSILGTRLFNFSIKKLLLRIIFFQNQIRIEI